ncbi:MAG: hypothetical protein ABGW91_01680 [Christiangramia sp.]
MDILINELSLQRQFESVEIFLNTSFSNFVKIFNFLYQVEKPILKNFQFYNCDITQENNLHSIISNRELSRTSDSIRKFKIILDKLISDPYWENDSQQDSEAGYTCNGNNVSGTSLAESYERESVLISFVPSDYDTDILPVLKNNEDEKILDNFTDNLSVADFLFKNNIINFHQYCREAFKNTKLSFEHINKEKSFDYLRTAEEESEYLKSFNLFCEMDWQSIIEQGGKGENKVGLAYEKYHNQKYFKNYNIPYSIDKFRCSKKFRAFGFRKGDTFYLLEFDLKHKLSD